MPEYELKGVQNIAGLQKRVTAKLVKSKIFLTREKIKFQKTFIYGGTRTV